MFRELRIEVNKTCNLACDHCYTEKKGKQSLQQETFINLIKDAANRGATDLSLTGGEPLIDLERTFALINAGKKYGLKVRLNTNGILIDDRIALILKDAGVDEIQISLNSSKADDFDKLVHRRGAFDKVINAIRILNKLDIDSTVRFTLMTRNIHQLLPTYKLVKELSVKNFKVRSVVQVNNIKDPSFLLNRQKIRNVLKKLIFRAKDDMINVFIADDGLGSIKSKTGQCDKLICKCGTDAIFVSSEGNITPCPFLREDSVYRLGNIETDNLFEVYKFSPLLKEFIGDKKDKLGGNDEQDKCKASILTSNLSS